MQREFLVCTEYVMFWNFWGSSQARAYWGVHTVSTLDVIHSCLTDDTWKGVIYGQMIQLSCT